MEKAKELRGRNYPYCPYVCHRNGKPFNQLRHGWDAACERVGVKGRTFHDLRRTGVRNLIRAGVPETVAMKISGHKTRSVFDRYDITSEEDLREAATRLEDYIGRKKVTLLVTPEDLVHQSVRGETTQPLENLAEGVGFEPTVPLPGLRFSRPVRSATPAPLHLPSAED